MGAVIMTMLITEFIFLVVFIFKRNNIDVISQEHAVTCQLLCCYSEGCWDLSLYEQPINKNVQKRRVKQKGGKLTI